MAAKKEHLSLFSQVHQYLNRYSEVSRLPKRHLEEAEKLYTAAQRQRKAWDEHGLQQQEAGDGAKQQQQKVSFSNVMASSWAAAACLSAKYFYPDGLWLIQACD